MLHACRYGELNYVLDEIKRGIVIDWNDGMVIACHGGRRDIVLLMIEKGATSWNCGMANACYGGQRDLVLLMIEKGATDWDRGLTYACYKGHKDLALLMIEKGAEIKWCCIKLEQDDIMRLIKVGVKNFGKYDKAAFECRKIMKEVETVLSELNIFPEFSQLVNAY